MSLSFADLVALATSVGMAQPEVAAAVAIAESSRDGHLADPSATAIVTQEQADAYNAAHPGGTRHYPERSFGLWQINTLAHPQYDETQLLDPAYNARAALAVSSGGKNWRPWSTFTSGLYRKYLAGAAGSGVGLVLVGVGLAAFFLLRKGA